MKMLECEVREQFEAVPGNEFPAHFTCRKPGKVYSVQYRWRSQPVTRVLCPRHAKETAERNTLKET